ncbi:MAG TPA: DUF2235 domain-containing protein [Candidatus Binatia bacterium]|nr:DUF2235 domain-containing protein [Candidatus Binatia bacterium]
MSKNIVICSDGTGNSDIKGRGTNVFKIFEAIDLNGHRTDPKLVPQVAFYDDGVGTENFKPLKTFTGATGFGLSRNVRQLYKELVRVYDPGDRIFLFGFSRGAFTVRTLADFICKCGILDITKLSTVAALESTVRKAYRVYRRCYRTEIAKFVLGDPDPSESAAEFKNTYCLKFEVRIAFIGVWDTVDAVGLPFHIGDFLNLFYRFKFPDYHLSPLVDRACHALAIDDERHSFHPLLWKELAGDDKRIEQVWFAGAHSNVGGGYPKQGMSLVALEWMMQKARAAGLRILDSDGVVYRAHANVDDKLYDPRAGLGIFYRWKPRDIAAICAENNVKPAIHLSVLERIAHGTEDYVPGNLPPNASIVITPTGVPQEDAAALERAREVESVLRSAHARRAHGQSLLSHVRPAIAIGLLSYYVYLLCCTAVIIAASARDDVRSLLQPWLLLRNGALLIADVLTFQIGSVLSALKQLATSPALLGTLGGGFLLSYLLAWFAEHRMCTAFSEFWHHTQRQLRRALKQIRETEPHSEADVRAALATDALGRGGPRLYGLRANGRSIHASRRLIDGKQENYGSESL